MVGTVLISARANHCSSMKQDISVLALNNKQLVSGKYSFEMK